mgnify:CR=1 FL=1
MFYFFGFLGYIVLNLLVIFNKNWPIRSYVIDISRGGGWKAGTFAGMYLSIASLILVVVSLVLTIIKYS